ncbi:PIN domain-containing protein [Natronosporangium hydrolyticum]|uniref:PIN domain-containing protein n=1 Tax=Natronosporangium hydrolyticum TaxID=2811111 RepID=A0A895YBJ8_9ACTN|nr:PIN domain-containing protein [Natronosporangium hydrolyticum]
MAIEGLYRPVWSVVILDELEYHEAAKLIKRGETANQAAERAQRLTTQMRTAFNDAEVHGWEGLEGTYGLPDEDDEHVVAAAVVAGAGAIITFSFRDFPPSRLPAIAPAEFAASTVSLDPVRAQAAVGAIAARSGRWGTRLTEDEIIDTLATRYGMTQAVDALRRAC